MIALCCSVRGFVCLATVGTIKRRDRIRQSAVLVLVLYTLNAVFACGVEHVFPAVVVVGDTVGGGGFIWSVVGG